MKTLKEIRAQFEGKRTVLCVVVRQEAKHDYQTVISVVDDGFSSVTVLRYFKLNGERWECSQDFRGFWKDAWRVVSGNFNDQLQDIAAKDAANDK